jgi:chemotaxis protein CheC
MEQSAAHQRDTQFDALTELGNIGVASALVAISRLIDAEIRMSVPSARVVPIEEMAQIMGGPETPVAAVHFGVKGDLAGRVAFVLPLESALRTIDLVMGNAPGTTGGLDDYTTSLIGEIGNIMTSAFLTALTDLSDLAMLPTPPETIVDMAAAVIASVLLGSSLSPDDVLSIQTRVEAREVDFQGHFIYVPQPGSLDRLLRAIGVA